MNGPLQYSRGRMQYTGRIDRAAFLAWARSAGGQTVVATLASSMRFALFGKHRAAQRRIWRRLNDAARSDRAVVALQQESDGYLARLDTLVHARNLPCATIDLRRLVAVPRLFVNAEATRRIDIWMDSQPAFRTLAGGRILREWFVFGLIESIEAALMAARPSPKRPLAVNDDWVVVGVNDRFEWRVPFRGPAWPGHYYVLELTRAPITRAVRKDVGDVILRMEASLPSLSRAQRTEILRHAGLYLEASAFSPHS